jgi:hypothetical protein
MVFVDLVMKALENKKKNHPSLFTTTNRMSILSTTRPNGRSMPFNNYFGLRQNVSVKFFHHLFPLTVLGIILCSILCKNLSVKCKSVKSLQCTMNSVHQGTV